MAQFAGDPVDELVDGMPGNERAEVAADHGTVKLPPSPRSRAKNAPSLSSPTWTISSPFSMMGDIAVPVKSFGDWTVHRV